MPAEYICLHKIMVVCRESWLMGQKVVIRWTLLWHFHHAVSHLAETLEVYHYKKLLMAIARSNSSCTPKATRTLQRQSSNKCRHVHSSLFAAHLRCISSCSKRSPSVSTYFSKGEGNIYQYGFWITFSGECAALGCVVESFVNGSVSSINRW